MRISPLDRADKTFVFGHKAFKINESKEIKAVKKLLLNLPFRTTTFFQLVTKMVITPH